MTTIEKLAEIEGELQKLTKERDGLGQALGDPGLVTWTHDGGPVPRRLTAFETATVKRIANLDRKTAALERQAEELLTEALCEIAGVEGEPDDPELLLRASLVTINRLHKQWSSTPESKLVLRVLLRYLKSLNDEDA